MVIADLFQKLIEAGPCKTETDSNVVKYLINVQSLSYGFPKGIRTMEPILKIKNWEVEKQMGLQQRYGSVYHPQFLGLVERANRSLKETLAKICAASKLS